MENVQCLLCYNTKLKSSEGGGGHSTSTTTTENKLFQRLLIFAEKRLKIDSSLFRNDNDPLNLNLFCDGCSEVVWCLCDLYEELRLVEKRMIEKLEEMKTLLDRGNFNCNNKVKGQTETETIRKGKVKGSINPINRDGGQPLNINKIFGVDGFCHLRDALTRQIQSYLEEQAQNQVEMDEIPKVSLHNQTEFQGQSPPLVKDEPLSPQPLITETEADDHFGVDVNNPANWISYPESESSMMDTFEHIHHHQDDDDNDGPIVATPFEAKADDPLSCQSLGSSSRLSRNAPRRKCTERLKRESYFEDNEDFEENQNDSDFEPNLFRTSPRSRSRSPTPQPKPKSRKLKKCQAQGESSKAKKPYAKKDSAPVSTSTFKSSSKSSKTTTTPVLEPLTLPKPEIPLKVNKEAQEEKLKLAVTDEEKKWASQPCPICGNIFLYGRNLMYHMSGIHEARVKRSLKKGKSKDDLPPFSCHLCYKRYYLEETVKVHLLVSTHKERYYKDFRCDAENGEQECPINEGQTYETMNDLRRHLERDHPEIPIKSCSTCHWPFLNKDAKNLHELFHLPFSTTTRKYHCPREGCTSGHKDMNALVGHYSQHHGVNLRPFGCVKCSSRFYGKQGLDIHEKDVHLAAEMEAAIDRSAAATDGPPPQVTCEVCGKSYKTRAKFNKHLRWCRIKGTCDICGLKLTDTSLLAKHITEVHSKEGRFQCSFPECGRRFQLKTAFKCHMRRHDKSKIFMCPHCPKFYNFKEQLKLHLTKRHPVETGAEQRKPEWICSTCGKQYFTRKTLRDHVLAKHTTAEERKAKFGGEFLCPLCPEPKSFPILNYLTVHLRRAHKVKASEVFGKDADFHRVTLPQTPAPESPPDFTQNKFEVQDSGENDYNHDVGF